MTIAVAHPDSIVLDVAAGSMIAVFLALTGTWCALRAARDRRRAVRIACTPAAAVSYCISGWFAAAILHWALRVTGVLA